MYIFKGAAEEFLDICLEYGYTVFNCKGYQIMKSLRVKYLIKADRKVVWRALTDARMIEKWGAGPAVMDDKVGTSFKLWGGETYGKNIRVTKYKNLRQEWYSGKWDEPSQVAFNLTERDNKTEIELVHEDIPDSDYEKIKDGWQRYYLGPLKDFAENNLI